MGAELGKRHVQGFQAGLHDVVNRLIDLVFVERLRTVDEEFEQLCQVDGLRTHFQDPALTAGIDISVPRQFSKSSPNSSKPILICRLNSCTGNALRFVGQNRAAAGFSIHRQSGRAHPNYGGTLRRSSRTGTRLKPRHPIPASIIG